MTDAPARAQPHSILTAQGHVWPQRSRLANASIGRGNGITGNRGRGTLLAASRRPFVPAVAVREHPVPLERHRDPQCCCKSGIPGLHRIREQLLKKAKGGWGGDW